MQIDISHVDFGKHMFEVINCSSIIRKLVFEE